MVSNNFEVGYFLCYYE